MSDELVFYTHPMSRGRTARWMLEEIGAPYRTELLGYGPPMKSPDYLAINPMGKVPAIVHRGLVVTELPAICIYLADAFPEAGLAPAVNDPARAAYYRWFFFAAGPLAEAVTARSLGVVVPQDKQGMVGYGTLERVTDTLDAELSRNEYLAGDRFTAVDLFAGAMLGWTTQFGMLEKRPSFEAYIERVMARPAALRAKQIDDTLLAEAQTQ